MSNLLLEEETKQDVKKFEEQKLLKAKQLHQFQVNKFVGLLNTGNLCYLNSAIQVIFNMPLLCDQILDFFKDKKQDELN